MFIDIVDRVDVVLMNGELLECGETENTELFHAVLGGLGQFGYVQHNKHGVEAAKSISMEEDRGK